MDASAALRHTLPQDRCCNCDARGNLAQVPIAFPLRTEGMPDGARWEMVLRMPFCPICLPSAKRRPLVFAEKFLIGFLLFIGLALLYGKVRAALGDLDPLVALGLLVTLAYGIAFGLPALMPKQHGQSSFWRPIRLQVPRAQVARGHLESLGFAFTSPSYATAFEMANAEAIRTGAITVKRVR